MPTWIVPSNGTAQLLSKPHPRGSSDYNNKNYWSFNAHGKVWSRWRTPLHGGWGIVGFLAINQIEVRWLREVFPAESEWRRWGGTCAIDVNQKLTSSRQLVALGSGQAQGHHRCQGYAGGEHDGRVTRAQGADGGTGAHLVAHCPRKWTRTSTGHEYTNSNLIGFATARNSNYAVTSSLNIFSRLSANFVCFMGAPYPLPVRVTTRLCGCYFLMLLVCTRYSYHTRCDLVRTLKTIFRKGKHNFMEIHGRNVRCK